MRNRTLRTACLVTILLLVASFFVSRLHAALWLPRSLSDNVLFQQGEPIVLWGKATPGAEITAAVLEEPGQTITRNGRTKTGSDGRWTISLEPLAASFTEYTIRITGDDQVRVIRGVLMGELWLAGGQSNMHLPVRHMLGGADLMQRANNPNLRIFYQDTVDEAWRKGVSATPADDTPGGKWLPASTGKNVADCSAVAYSFGLALFGALNQEGRGVPVGIINTPVGATGIASWISRAALEQVPELKVKLPAQWNVGEWKQFHQPWNQAAALFNHKIAPLTNHAVCGFLWYQGENDAGFGERGAAVYKTALATLIADWRRQWGGKARPFILSQLHAYDNEGKVPPSKLENWAYLREAQFEVAESVPQTAAIPIHDVPLTWNVDNFAFRSPVHPLEKRPVGERMALAARALAYGEPAEYRGPVFDRMILSGEKAVIYFRHAAGLNFREGNQLLGFTICGPDRQFVTAQARIVGDTVEVSSPAVKKPVAVAYGFTSQNHCANLFNAQNLPAFPFRTDKVPSGYLKGCAAGQAKNSPKPSPAAESSGPGSDVIIYGGTSSGCIAAVQAAKMGKSVVLIEPGRHLGGLTSGGLGLVDAGITDSVGGLTHEFFHRVWRHYQESAAWKWEKPVALRGQHAPLRSDARTLWLVEPSVAERLFDEMVSAAGVKVVRGERLDRKKGVRKDAQRIVSISVESGQIFAGRMFIDATYEGDLMAAAGVSCFVGREANTRYGETMNGIRPMPDRATALRIDPYRVKGKPESGLLPRVHPDLGGKAFEEDQGVQAYCYRMCLTDVPENRIPIQKPAGYDELEYELVFRYIERGAKKESFIKLSRIPNRKTDSNNNGSFSTDYIGMSWGWAEADYATRERIAREHEKWQRGLLWTLQNHPRVPPEIREYYAPWGLPRDEFRETGNWSHQLYVREARRMVADVVIAEDMALGFAPAPEDSVGLGSYAFDSHAIKYYVDEASGFVTIDGALYRPPRSTRPPHPYPISFRAIIPKRGQCENLLVPVCLSATHVTYGSIRMEPVFMILGQSAATAACLALDQNLALQNLPYESLRKRLLADKQIIAWSKSRAPVASSADLEADLQVLLKHKLILDAAPWRECAVKGQTCRGEDAAVLLVRAANAFSSADSVEQALGVLSAQRILASVDYWKQHAASGQTCNGESIRTLIRNLARNLETKAPGSDPASRAQKLPQK